MLVSYQWLKDYVNMGDLTPEEVAEKLTRGGVEVDVIHPRSQGLANVTVGYIEECVQHPDADKLRICQVNTGEGETSQIICGAPNVAAGQRVAVARPGAVLPGGVKIKKTKLRGEHSEGMICSLQELGIEQKLVAKEFIEGIYVFPEDAVIGEDAIEQLGMHDTVLELDLTPNRADCLSMLGVAYEMAALLDQEVHHPGHTFMEAEEEASDRVSVQIDVPKDNPYYNARIIKNITIGPSPLWMQNRLTAAGIRPINNVVDITNYVLLEYGQPLHAFDLERLGSKEIVVRRAANGEKMTTLDNVERTLSDEYMVITNGKEPVALAGVMGGAFSEVQDDTTSILLEAAYFSPVRIRKASRALGLRSEASVRYEKGIDAERVEEASDRAVSLLAKYAGGKVLKGAVEQDYRSNERKTIITTPKRLNEILGTELAAEEMIAIFKRLGLEVKTEETSFIITIPSRRPDLMIEEDLAEEVARLYGYDRIPTTLPEGVTTPGSLSYSQVRRRKIRRYLEASGLDEAITYSLTSPEKASRFLLDDVPGTVAVSMPMSEERSTMRTSLVPHLLDVIQYNQHRQLNDAALFELGSVFIGEKGGLNKQPRETMMLSVVVTGNWETHLWQGEKKRVDFYVIKGIVEGLFNELKIPASDVHYRVSDHPELHPGRSADVLLNGRKVGFAGQVHPRIEKEWDIKETYVFQVNMDELLQLDVDDVSYKQLPRYPSVTRDIALVVDKTVSAAEVQEVIEKAGGKLLNHVTLFDVYEGDTVEAGKKSLAFSIVYLDPNRTLTDEEVTNVHDRVLTELEEKLQAALRK
ncbi:phenylalanine--tRNA ligase subunit beta [Bacillus piscicola]|uniref:phenylalanine--tRNA ligase subunit beta n=1 Tax=Bacillus piscicola TaxID=1632684 RepID=UPI001F092146|nr:phenylalanine--tRNA ligase subunit beta [Bacillus piscicola]